MITKTDLELYALLGKIKSIIQCVDDKIFSKEEGYNRVEDYVEEFEKIRKETK